MPKYIAHTNKKDYFCNTYAEIIRLSHRVIIETITVECYTYNNKYIGEYDITLEEFLEQ